jgi:hypothetical protein
VPLVDHRRLTLRVPDQLRDLVVEQVVHCAWICARCFYQFAQSLIRNSAVAGESRQHIGMAKVLRPGFHRLGRQIARHGVVNQHVAKTVRIEVG